MDFLSSRFTIWSVLVPGVAILQFFHVVFKRFFQDKGGENASLALWLIV